MTQQAFITAKSVFMMEFKAFLMTRIKFTPIVLIFFYLHWKGRHQRLNSLHILPVVLFDVVECQGFISCSMWVNLETVWTKLVDIIDTINILTHAIARHPSEDVFHSSQVTLSQINWNIIASVFPAKTCRLNKSYLVGEACKVDIQ